MMNTTSLIGRLNEKTASAVFLCIVYQRQLFGITEQLKFLPTSPEGPGRLTKKMPTTQETTQEVTQQTTQKLIISAPRPTI
jgi:hypothetical protein